MKVGELLEKQFRVKERGSSYLQEFRAGLVLFMASAYIIFLNPLILSGGSIGFPTGMPVEDVTLATCVSTGIATLSLGVVANYPWVASVQLGTNTYFVNNVLQPFYPCGAHSTLIGDDEFCPTGSVPCTCTGGNSTSPPTNPTAFTIASTAPANCSAGVTSNVCLGTKISFEKALAATFLEGLVFLFICFTGLRYYILKLFPKQVLLAGACGIGVFISFVGYKDSGFITQAPYPTLLRLNLDNQYNPGPVINMTYHDGPRWNSCELYFAGAPFGVQCNWLALGGLIFTGLLMCWDINGAFIAGILFTTFISWIIFPEKYNANPPGLVPPSFAEVPSFSTTAGALDFNWKGDYKTLIEAFFTFLYLDFIGSAITFSATDVQNSTLQAMGQMCGMLNENGDIPRSNLAFIADGLGTTIGGLTGTSALTTYVESAAAVREGGRTGVTACVCAVLFFLSCFFFPWTGHIPTIATGPILLLIGVVIFMSAVYEVHWKDMKDAIPAYITMLTMPFTHNIAYGVIAGWIAWILSRFFTYSLLPDWPLYQSKWPGANYYAKRMERDQSMFVRIPGWNDHHHLSKEFDAMVASKSMGGTPIHSGEVPKVVSEELPKVDLEAPSSSSD